MHRFQCTEDIFRCTQLYNVSLCATENNMCIPDHGYCVSGEIINPTCICSPCFFGDHCELEVSRNLWSIGTISVQLRSNKHIIEPIILIVFGAFLLLNGVLCLQTYLCKNIRKTNLGIYLIMLSIVSILIGLLHIIFHSIAFYINDPQQLSLFEDLNCLINQKYVYFPMVFMYNWFIASVAIERMLVQCSRNYGLHDSRRRSLLSSAFIIIICLLSTIPGFFTVQANQPSDLRSIQCINFTPIGYVLYQTITHIHLFAFYFIYILMNVIVLQHLLRHRRRFVDNDSFATQAFLILSKHKDFFVPYLIQSICQLPGVIMNLIMTCPTADTVRVAQIKLAFTFLQIAPFSITFYLYIYLSPVYWAEFWDSSPVGKCLMRMRKMLHTGNHTHIIAQKNNQSGTPV